MKKVIVIVTMVLCYATVFSGNNAFAKSNAALSFFQQFVSHQVKDGETVYSISKDYGITEKEILKLNPDAKARIYEGLVLILPSTAQNSSATTSKNQEVEKFKTHKVKRKETLYSISKKYGVSQDKLKKYNKQLYSRNLRKGDKIKIPLHLAVLETKASPAVVAPIDETTITSTVVTLPATQQYEVKVKETKYGIARKYGITITQLEELNPTIGAGLQEGVFINVPNVKSEMASVIDETQFSFYEVQKGNTMYSLLRKFDIKADYLLALNPNLDGGLKEGMILKVPKDDAAQTISNITTSKSKTEINQFTSRASLADSITDYSVKNIAVMLPFGLKRTNADTSNVRKDLLKSDRVLRLALDFHSGILMAVKDAEKLGITANVTVYDTDYERIPGANGTATNARKVENIIRSNDFSNVDAVIGPVLGGNVDRAASLLASRNIPVVSPLTQRISGGSNVFQSRPSDDILRKKMIDYLETQGEGKNVIIIADSKNIDTKGKLKGIFPNAKEVTPRNGDNGMFLHADDLTMKIANDIPNLVILETNDIPLISNVTTGLNALLSQTIEEQIVQKNDIRLATTSKGSAYNSDEIQHMHLMNLGFQFPSMEKEYDEKKTAGFIDAYESKYKITPSTEAIRGYDIMMDTLLRLAYAQNLFDAAANGVDTGYIENKFNYSKGAKGYYNTAAYILEYKDNLLLNEVSIDAPDKE